MPLGVPPEPNCAPRATGGRTAGGWAAGGTLAGAEAGWSAPEGFHPSGGMIWTMLPHFGHATIAPMESALRTASFAPQVVHEIEKRVSATISEYTAWMMGTRAD